MSNFDTESMMRSSMYSTRSKLFNAAQDDTVTVVLDSLKVSNVLELTDRQREILSKIREFMREQADSLRNEVEAL